MTAQATKNIPLLDLKTQYTALQNDIEAAVLDVLRSGWYVMGPNHNAFQQEAAELLGAKHAIGCANGSDALYIALLALDVKAGDEVIVPPFTYVATAEAVTQTGATPVFADVDINSFNIDVKEIEKKITDKTKVIIVVHLYGQACEMDAIMKLAEKNNIKVIEDTAQAFGTKYKNKSAGCIGDIGTYSFYPTKNLSAAGDAGMMTTNSNELAARLSKIRVHGSSKRYYHDELGVNSRLDEIQAAVLRIKLKHITAWNEQRAVIAKRYNEALTSIETENFKIITPSTIEGSSHIYHQYSIRVESKNSENHRDRLKEFLKENGVASEIYYPLSLHMQNIYSDLGYKAEDLPQTIKATEEVLCLPVYPELPEEDQDYVIETIKKFA